MAASSIRTLRKKTVPLRPTTDDSETPTLPLPDDPLGIDLQGRGMQAAREHMLPFGPLPAPRWAGFFQALADRGVSRIGPSVGERGSAVHEYGPMTYGTAGDALAGVEQSMPYYVPPPPPPKQQQPTAPQAQAPKAPEPPPDNRRAYEKTAPYDPRLGRERVQAGMQPGSLAALLRQTGTT